MRNIVIATLIFLCLTSTAVLGQDSMEFYNRGLKSSLASKRIAYFTAALQLNPNLVEAYEKRAIHYYFQERLNEAIQDYTRIIALEPHGVNAYLMRGQAYMKKGHGEGFMAEINRLAIRLSKQRVPSSNESLERAIHDFSRAIELYPQLASAFSYRAEAYRLIGMTDEAIRDSTTAVQLRGNPHSTASAYATRAEIYRRLDQDELYEADLRKSIELDPYSHDYPPLHVPLMLGYSANITSSKTVRWLGLLGIIVLTFVLLFQLTLRAPTKRD